MMKVRNLGKKSLEEVEQKEAYKEVGIMLFGLLKPIFENERTICEIAEACDCSLIDIFNALFSYYGRILFKKPQAVRWLKTTIRNYSSEAKSALGITAI